MDFFWPIFSACVFFYWWGYRTGRDHGHAEGVKWCIDQEHANDQQG